MYGVLPQLGFAALPAEQAIEFFNETIMVVVMIESPTAVDNADARTNRLVRDRDAALSK